LPRSRKGREMLKEPLELGEVGKVLDTLHEVDHVSGFTATIAVK
jgi:hypothetical protein